MADKVKEDDEDSVPQEDVKAENKEEDELDDE